MEDEAMTERIWFSLAAPEVIPLRGTVCVEAFNISARF